MEVHSNKLYLATNNMDMNNSIIIYNNLSKKEKEVYFIAIP
jgi:hypothetical protein